AFLLLSFAFFLFLFRLSSHLFQRSLRFLLRGLAPCLLRYFLLLDGSNLVGQKGDVSNANYQTHKIRNRVGPPEPELPKAKQIDCADKRRSTNGNGKNDQHNGERNDGNPSPVNDVSPND